MWRTAISMGAAITLFSVSASAEDAVVFTPKSITMNAKPCGQGWREWEGIANIEGLVAARERITSLSAGTSGDIWVGTSHGRLLSMADGKWTLQAHLTGIQITGMALDGADKVWLSTNDGIRRLDREKESWKLTEYRTYYEGHPGFVSGGYIPGEDAVRLWGYVDSIYIPLKIRAYAPLVISTEHGLFCWGGYHGVWHHFMPHYWGANSAWLDTRELIPRRRPTCIVEDAEANLWIGTDGDGIVRLNAPGRDYHKRPPENNKKDGTEFASIAPKDIGAEFDKVMDLAAGLERGVWAVLALKGKKGLLARFDGKSWTTMSLEEKIGAANCITEVRPGVVFVGVGYDYRDRAMIEVDWASRNVSTVPGPKYDIRKVTRMADGRVFAASWFGLYEKTLKP